MAVVTEGEPGHRHTGGRRLFPQRVGVLPYWTRRGRFRSTSAVATLADVTSNLSAEAEARGSQAEAALRSIDETRSEQEERANSELEKTLETIRADAKGAREDLQEQATSQLESLRRDAQTGRKLVQLVGDQSVAGGYHKFAQTENNAYRLWTVLGVGVIIITVGFLVYEFRDFDTLSLQAVIVRAALAIPAFGVSAYAFQQAARRQRQSVEARYKALDLLALPPFSNDMSEDQQEKLRVTLGERLFAASAESRTSSKGRVADSPSMDLEQLRVLSEVIRNFRDTPAP